VAPSAIVLDASLLVLLVVGTASQDYILRHKRLQAYSKSDFALLTRLLAAAPKIIVTPNTLTEASNLLRQIPEPARTHICRAFRALLELTEERYVESRQAADKKEFIGLGLTDAVLLDTTASTHVLLTADLDLYLAAMRDGRSAVNFNHYRAM
jgi:hypothetical protein